MDSGRDHYFKQREAEERAKAVTCAPEVKAVHVAMADLYAAQARTARALSCSSPLAWAPVRPAHPRAPLARKPD